MRPHARVHGGGDKYRLVGGEQYGGGEVVGQAVGELGQEVCRGRGDDHQVGLARQADVPDLVLVIEIKEVAEDTLAGQSRDRQRRDEVMGGLGEHSADAGAALLQPADQL
jgi:hypothetical protein